MFRLVTDYGAENPLLYDYYNFPEALYQLKFKSRGDSELANKIVDTYKKASTRLVQNFQRRTNQNFRLA